MNEANGKTKTYKYLDTKTRLMEDIRKMKVGDTLKNRNQLAKKYGVARITVERAVSELIGEGILLSRDGSGTYVAKLPKELEYTAMGAQHSKICTTEVSGNIWALLMSNIQYDTAPIILASIENVARERGYNLMIRLTDNQTALQDECAAVLLDSDIKGALIVPAISGAAELAHLSALKSQGIPIVAVGRQCSGLLTPTVQCNSFEAGFLGTEHLISHGCRRIAYLSSASYNTSTDRFQGYLCALRKAGLPVENQLIHFDDRLNERKPGQKGVERLFSGQVEFDGVYAFNDRIAYQVYQAAVAAGLEIGKDIRLVTCDDTEICTMMPMGFTTIRQPIRQMSRNAALLLDGICNGRQVPDHYLEILGNELISRESCGCGKI